MDVVEDNRSSEPKVPACNNCGITITSFEGRTPLCMNCRAEFKALSIPTWVKAFGGGVLLLLIISMVSLPKQISTGVHLKRGIKAAEEHKYATSEKELQAVVKQQPDYKEAQCRLLMSAYYNNDLATVAKCFEKLKDKSIEDKELYSQVSTVLERLDLYVPKDSFTLLENKAGGPTDKDFRTYLGKNNDPYAIISYASFLLDKKEYIGSDSLLNIVLSVDENYYLALALKASLKRQIKQLDSSYYFLDRMLGQNKEDAFALASKARTLLLDHKDKEAVEFCNKSLSFDPSSGYGLATLALIYHCQNNFKKRDELLSRAQKDSSLAGSFIYVIDVVSGKEKFRD
jgi:tetratricopeptide (TPR) repeat protein